MFAQSPIGSPPLLGAQPEEAQLFDVPLPSTPRKNASAASGPSRFQESPQGNTNRPRACPVVPRLKPPHKLKKGGEQLKLPVEELQELSGGQAKNSLLKFKTPEGLDVVYKYEPKGQGRGAVKTYQTWFELQGEHGQALKTIKLLGYEETKEAVLTWYEFCPHPHPVKGCTSLNDLPKLCLNTLTAMKLWKEGGLTHHDIKAPNLFFQDPHTVLFGDFSNNGFGGGLGDMDSLEECTKQLVLSADDSDDYDQIWWVMFVTTFMAGLDHEEALAFVRTEDGFDAFPTVRDRILDPNFRKLSDESKEDFDFPEVDQGV